MKRGRLVLQLQSGEPLVEPRHLPAGLSKLDRAARPRGMRQGIDIKLEGVTRLAPSGPGCELRSVGHDDLDLMVIGMNVFLHCSNQGTSVSSGRLDTELTATIQLNSA